jgi:hypothetical protein
MKEYSKVRVCLFMSDGFRIITDFFVNYHIRHCDFEREMISTLNQCDTFRQVRNYREDFDYENFELIVINTKNIIRIKTIEVR